VSLSRLGSPGALAVASELWRWRGNQKGPGMCGALSICLLCSVFQSLLSSLTVDGASGPGPAFSIPRLISTST